MKNNDIFSNVKLCFSRKKANEKGITLIALIVTIIVLLILIGVTVYLTVNGKGIFYHAKRAAFVHDMKSYQEQVKLYVSDKEMEVIDNKTTMADINVGLEGEDKTIESLNIKIADKYKKHTDSSENTIPEQVVVQTTHKDGEMKTQMYYLRDSNIPNNDTYIEWCKQVGIPIWPDDNGEKQNTNPTDSNVTGKIIFKDLTWSNGSEYGSGYGSGYSSGYSSGYGKASIKIEGIVENVDDSEKNNYYIEYSTYDSTYSDSWTRGNTVGEDTVVTGLSSGTTLYAKLTDGTNVIAKSQITIKDKLDLSVSLSRGEVTTNSINVTANATYYQSNMPDNPTFDFYIKESSTYYYPDTPSQSGTDTSFAATGLTSNTEYTIKVETKDTEGNTASAEININTMPNSEEIKEGTITFSTPTWLGGKASVTISTDLKNDSIIEYQVNSIDGKWTKGTNPTGLLNKDTVYARLRNGAYVSDVASITIEDSTPPIVTLKTRVVTTNSISVTASATDNETGMPENPIYNFYIKESSESNYPDSPAQSRIDTSFTETDLQPYKIYTIKVETRDIAGNAASAEININTMPNSEEIKEGTITFSTPTWLGGKASVTISTDLKNDSIIEYQVNSIDGKWTKGTNPTGLLNKDTVYARLRNGAYVSDVASITIEDKTPPTITLTRDSGTIINSIHVTASATDKESGMPESPTYTFYLKEDGGEYEQKQSGCDTQYLAENLKEETNYEIKVETTDIAGNSAETSIIAYTYQIQVGDTVYYRRPTYTEVTIKPDDAGFYKNQVITNSDYNDFGGMYVWSVDHVNKKIELLCETTQECCFRLHKWLRKCT